MNTNTEVHVKFVFQYLHLSRFILVLRPIYNGPLSVSRYNFPMPFIDENVKQKILFYSTIHAVLVHFFIEKNSLYDSMPKLVHFKAS